MDYSTEHKTSQPSEKQAVFTAVCELIQEQFPVLLRRILRDTSDHEQWLLPEKEKTKFLQLLENKERIVISSFMFHLKQNLDKFEKSSASPLRIVPRVETTRNEGIYSDFNETLMQRLSDVIGRPAIPLTENPIHLFNLKQSWHYAVDSLFLSNIEKSILINAFDQQLAPQLGSFYRAVDSLLFDASVLPELPIARLRLRDPADYADTMNSSLGDIGVEFSHLILSKRQQRAIAEEKARKVAEMHAEIKRSLAENRDKLDKRQGYFFDNLWLPYLTKIAMDKGSQSKPWKKAMAKVHQFNQTLHPCGSRDELRRLLEGWPSATKSLNKALNKLSATSHQKQVLKNFFDRSFEHVLKSSVDMTAGAIQATRPLSAQGSQCRASQEFKRMFDHLQLPASDDLLERISSGAVQVEVPLAQTEMRTGEWAEMKQRRTRQKLMIKLAWRADDSSSYIFVDRSGKRVCQIDHTELMKKLDSGEIKPLSQINTRAAHQNLSTLRSL